MYNSINNHDSLLYLTSLTGFFLEDKVSCVREIAADAMSEIIRISNPKQREAIVKYFLVQEFANSDSWRKRQTFLNIFYKLIKCENQLVDLLQLIFSSMKRLSYDAVPNIRLLVAKNLVQLININEKTNGTVSEDILQVIRRLREDDDRDVRELFDSVDYLKAEKDETDFLQQVEEILNALSEEQTPDNKGAKLSNENNIRINNPIEGGSGGSYSDILKAAPPPLTTSVTDNIEQEKYISGIMRKYNTQTERNT